MILCFYLRKNGKCKKMSRIEGIVSWAAVRVRLLFLRTLMIEYAR